MLHPILEVNGVTKTIGKRLLINKTSFKLEKGKIYGFIGPNGAGKTTLMRIMTGLIQPTTGEVLIDSKSIVKEREEAISKIGAIIESPVFFDYMTGRQVLRNLSRLHKTIKKSEREKHITELLQRVGLEGRADESVKTYSLGMKQRLGIAQSMLGHPEILLLDEPSNGLDPMGMRELRDIIIHLRETENYTFFISSHLLDELQHICDHLIVIREGKIVWSGETADLVNEGERLEDSFMRMMQS
ncbi:ATP-binding cassette domain-containing protein [Paenibacillus thiaminolyticus]|uniref:ATP-binding cassette domain-containing protein n=1 Tax=Paenibacillus thiaminolyticus TaxID=49283 RepID=A0AAP9DU43_PANTH|nr:ATP-binding cassette domain-containing protein [Paenibacillus thiaminolyticus]MCY9537993.1 ATP-binding cassette domain-containing protein [Paenibacillus thiaminolyticus]MCY9604941.1 ATP-binding cassette domain-containing protein [Paenibacillus thiaminolyticus]MCY9610676.1 ATP-binding cassette domain-containing protein [Paenibacillus thiaminolyticus]MCY9616005.1 ATP-binding cassette domain-containing protein [Paenibacillus thiaminolyticus]MCY9622411.1 ATP-binding cassette domain-containing p